MKKHAHFAPEVLESRIAPALLLGITSNKELAAIQIDGSTSTVDLKPITGLAGGAAEVVLGMDVRPATQDVYFLTSTSGVGRLYTLNIGTGAATAVATMAADPTDVSSPYSTLSGTGFGVDFNPVADRIRVVSDNGASLRVNPTTGLVTTDSNINPGSPAISAVAYTNSLPGATTTTLYALSAADDRLYTVIPPNNGVINLVGLTGLSIEAGAHFDIAPNGTAYVLQTTGGTTAVSTVNLSTGAATQLTVLPGNSTFNAMTVLPVDVKFLNATTATYLDEDGDTVTVKVTKGTLQRGDFTFAPAANGGGQLRLLNLADDGQEFKGAGITISAKRGALGDGSVRVGAINATGVDLGAVVIGGDLGSIDAGDVTITDGGIKSLSAFSMGRHGTTTSLPGANLDSTISGAVGSIKIKTDLQGVFINITGGADAKLGSLTIGGSLLGDTATNTGRVYADGAIGTVKIGRDVVAGTGTFSASVDSSVSLGAVTIGGSVVGGGTDSARIVGLSGIGAVKIGGNVLGSGIRSAIISASTGAITSVTIGGVLVGGLETSGRINAFGAIGSVTIAGDLLGGTEFGAGSIEAKSLGAVKIGGSVRGGAGTETGTVRATEKIASLAIGGELRGGTGSTSGSTFAGSIGPVTIGLDMVGGASNLTGTVETDGPMGAVNIGGSLIGGGGTGSGYLHAKNKMGLVKIRGSVIGGSGSNSGLIYAGSAIINISNFMDGVSIGGNLIGGSGNGSGSIGSANGAVGGIYDLDIGPITIKGSIIGGGSGSATITGNNVKSIKVGGDVRGGTGTESAYVRTTGTLGTLAVGGSLVGTVSSTALIDAFGIGTATIKRDLRGGSGGSSGAIQIYYGDAKSILIGGSIISGTGAGSASIEAESSIGSLTVNGDVVGNSTARVNIAALGKEGKQTAAIGKVTIKGSMNQAAIVGGYSFGFVANADAGLGPITIGGDFIASSIATGVLAGADQFFGTADDAAATTFHTAGNHSIIASIIIGGQAIGTPGNTTDGFGIVAQEIKKLKIGAASYPALNATTQGPVSLSPLGDVLARTDV